MSFDWKLSVRMIFRKKNFLKNFNFKIKESSQYLPSPQAGKNSFGISLELTVLT